MKVIVRGEMDVDLLAKKLIEVAESTAARVQNEQEGVAINGYAVHEAEVTFKFDVEGLEEPQVLTVEHHEGHPEMLTWIVDVEDADEGNEGATVSNEAESMYDAWTVAQSTGKDFEFKEVASVYNIVDLEEIPDLSEVYDDMSKKVYEHKDGYKVVQVRQNKKLIQEYKLVPKGEDVIA